MILLRLAFKSLKNRKATALLTMTSIALSVTLLLSVEKTKTAAEEGFTQSVSQVDLLVGARTGPLNLILYSVFNMGNATNNISWESYQEIKNYPEVEWTIPYSLGDGHRGFRVVATDENFYKHYRYRGHESVEFKQGIPAKEIWDVVIGSQVSDKLNYKIGDSVVIAHGVTRGDAIQQHDDKPFRIVGILKPTGTSIDQSLYITLYGMEAIHIDWKNGAQPTKENAIPQSQLTKENIQIGPITSFFLRTKSRIQTLKLQRQINNFENESLLAIIPGATLADLWRGLSQINVVLKVISMMVLVIGLAAMVSTILASLNERRREMSILRSIGAGPTRMTILLVFESSLITFFAVAIGTTVHLLTFHFLSGWIESEFGFYIRDSFLTKQQFVYLVFIWMAGTIIGFIPAMQASHRALKDGLTLTN